MLTFDFICLLTLIAFTVISAIQLFYYLCIFIRVPFYKNKTDDYQNEAVSIVVCARNEANNLENYLPLLLEQDYPDFEVVVVNDCSEDETEDVLKRLKIKYPHLKTTFIKEDEKFSHGKKLALTVGIKAAKNEWLLLTDADCFPENNQWLKTMARNFKTDTSIVLGYGGFTQESGFLNKLIRYDAAIIALQYFSLALIGKPYMGVGRNLAYRKSLFFANKGFASHARLTSGDDDLFINETATSKNVRIEPFAHTRSKAKQTLNHWVEQKTRHFTTFGYYKNIHKIILGTEIFSRVLFYFLFIALLILQKFWIAGVSIFLFRLICQMIIFKITYNRLNEKKLFLISPMFDLILPFINLGIYVSGRIRPRKQWR